MGGEQVNFYSHKKGEAGNDAGGGGDTTCFGVVVIQMLEVLAILKGGANSFTLPRNDGGYKRFWTPNFYFVAPPP